MDLLARLQNHKIFASLDLRLDYYNIGLTPEANLKPTFTTTSGKGTGTWLLLVYAHFKVSSSILCHRYYQV